jgi:hypothetical protein
MSKASITSLLKIEAGHAQQSDTRSASVAIAVLEASDTPLDCSSPSNKSHHPRKQEGHLMPDLTNTPVFLYQMQNRVTFYSLANTANAAAEIAN